jgi:hypothetical protein
MKKQLLCGLLVVVAMSTGLQILKAAPIDVTEGYRDFKWGMSPDAVFAKAKELYGSNPVSKHKGGPDGFFAQGVLDGIDEESIRINRKDDEITLYFFNGKLSCITRTLTMPIVGNYTMQEFEESKLTNQPNQLYSSSNNIEIQCGFLFPASSKDANGNYTVWTGDLSEHNKVIGKIMMHVSIKNKSLIEKEIADIRLKKPSVVDQVLTRLEQ